MKSDSGKAFCVVPSGKRSFVESTRPNEYGALGIFAVNRKPANGTRLCRALISS